MPFRPNEHLVGVAGSRGSLMTPALLLDLDALEHNIQTMARLCADRRLSLRPHFKSHKSVRIARMQLAAGALGMCAATVREAAVLAEAGIGNIHLTSPVVVRVAAARFLSFQGPRIRLSAVIDGHEGYEILEKAARAAGHELRVFVDVDLQAMFRTGVASGAAALDLAERLRQSDVLEYAGVQFYSGIVQHIPDPRNREDFYGRQLAKLRELAGALTAAGLQPGTVTGGGTGTFAIDARSKVVTESQAGSYPLMDVEYRSIDLLIGEGNPFRQALFVQSAVVSNNARGMVTVDAGTKSLPTDGPAPTIAAGAPEGCTYHQFGDEFGVVLMPGALSPETAAGGRPADRPRHEAFYGFFGNLAGDAEQLPVGTRIEFAAPHCDPTVNLFNHYHCVRGDTLVDIWPIDARGNL
jgi:D-serine deaminase-like pyridoxal phosphate-dependent protein